MCAGEEKGKLLYNYRTWGGKGRHYTDVCGWKIGRKQQFEVHKSFSLVMVIVSHVCYHITLGDRVRRVEIKCVRDTDLLGSKPIQPTGIHQIEVH